MLEKILAYERDVFLWLNGGHTPFGDCFMWLYTGKIVWIPLIAGILVILCYKKNWKDCLMVILFIALTITLCDQFASSVCKPLFTRLRPTHHPDFMEHVQTVFGYRGGKYGFISSHTANAFGFSVFTLLLFRYRWYTVAILIWSILMSYSRIYLGVHFISDIVPAAIAGAAFGFLGYKGYVFTHTQLLKSERTPPLSYSDLQKRLIIYGLGLTVAFMLVFSYIKVSANDSNLPKKTCVPVRLYII
ncbi:MAG: phosphatase PAP2 family protein [Dysgonamonadaceae bacterium]|jgi:undecaprenyl-diphosphatase|nr:phosphatase PAP2 family protein [Dysgonamonadaceae bacterium]